MERLTSLPIPAHFNPQTVAQIWKTPYEQRAAEARAWAHEHNLQPVSQDTIRIGLLLIDVQNTFCLPDFELFVSGRSGSGAVDDNRRLCEFIYRNLGAITEIIATLDTHQAQQIFHALFLVDDEGNHPGPYTLVSAADILEGRWHFNPALADSLGKSHVEADHHLKYYTSKLNASGKYDLTIWPYHAMLGGIGHAMVPAVEEAIFFHSMARYATSDLIIKGNHPWTEAYSAIGPEILDDANGNPIAEKSLRIFNKLQSLDALFVAGQAKSHCVAWTVEDLLHQIQENKPDLCSRVYLLEDCTSPVVVAGVVDYTEAANEAFRRFEDAGINICTSTQVLSDLF